MSRRVMHCFGFALIVCAAFVWASRWAAGRQAATPQSDSAQAREDLPFGDLFTADELRNSFAAQQFTPHGNRKLSFEILAPKGWEGHVSEIEPDQLAHDDQGPVPLVDFSPSGVDDVGASVLYMRVPAQTSLEAFLDGYAKNAGGTLVTRQKLEFKGRTYEDALMRTNDDTLGPILSRVSAFRRGDLVFVFNGWSAEEKYQKNKRAFAAILASLNPTGN